jgi:hypothetical protein
MRIATLALVFTLPASLLAADQAEQLVPEGTTIQLILLRQKSVQDELKLTPVLVKKIIVFTNKEYEACLQAMKLGEKERDQKLQELQKANREFLADILKAAQRKRLAQIAIQLTGLQQLTLPGLVKALSLTEEQQQKFKEMQKEARKELEEIIKETAGRLSRRDRTERLAKLRAEIDKKVEAVLTPEQKEKAKELAGKPFKGKIIIEDAESAPKE